MKVALCLHGLFNSTQDNTSNGEDGYVYIKKNILNKADTDVFIHSWDIEKQKIIENLYKPKKSIFENQIDFSDIIISRGIDNLHNMPRSPQSVLSHIFSVSKAIGLLYKCDTKYDIVIKARFDLGRINRNTSGPGLGNIYPVQCINFQTNIDNNKIYMANWNHFHMGPADMWFYGSYNIMNKFITIYDDILNEFKLNSDFHNFAKTIENNSGDLSNSIAFYKYWMMKNTLWENKILLETEWE